MRQCIYVAVWVCGGVVVGGMIHEDANECQDCEAGKVEGQQNLYARPHFLELCVVHTAITQRKLIRLSSHAAVSA